MHSLKLFPNRISRNMSSTSLDVLPPARMPRLHLLRLRHHQNLSRGTLLDLDKSSLLLLFLGKCMGLTLAMGTFYGAGLWG